MCLSGTKIRRKASQKRATKKKKTGALIQAPWNHCTIESMDNVASQAEQRLAEQTNSWIKYHMSHYNQKINLLQAQFEEVKAQNEEMKIQLKQNFSRLIRIRDILNVLSFRINGISAV